MPRYTLGDREFPRKGDAVDYIRDLLNSTPLRTEVRDPLLYALLERHPQHSDKTRYGVAAIEVIPDDWGHRCFAIRTDDGALIAFSFRECFKPSTPAQDAKAALRVEIRHQIDDFRRSTPLVCAVTGVPLTLARGRRDTAEVDHAPPATFDALAEQWAAGWGGWTNVANHQDGQRRYLTHDEQRESWRAHHADRATLRLLSAAAHRNVGGTA